MSIASCMLMVNSLSYTQRVLSLLWFYYVLGLLSLQLRKIIAEKLCKLLEKR